MSAKTTVWTLNDAYKLISGPQKGKSAEQVQKELCALFDQKIQFGQRPVYGNQLMPDVEYFVPIAPRCIGGLFDSSSGEARSILDNVRNYYTNCAKQYDYKKFWDTEIRDYQMKTEKYIGYYSILEETAPNILIGFSQGSLTARYLNWLDKNVFKKNIIKGVITISSPDFGSPLANNENIKTIVKGFTQILLVILGFKPDGVLSWLLLKYLKIENILNVLKDLKSVIDSDEHLKHLDDELLAKNKKLSGTIAVIIDWLGGLRNDPNDAFYDLNIFRMEKNYSTQAAEYSVLASVNRPLMNPCPITGTISANMKSKDFLYDAIISAIIGVLKKFFSEHSVLAKAAKLAGLDLSKAENFLNGKKFNEIDKIYSQTVMSENHSKPVSNNLIKNVLSWKTGGLSSPVIAPLAHDFIIPSAYQLTLDNSMNISKDNFVNDDANHVSASDPDFAAGRSDKEKVLEYLRKLI